MASPPAVPVVMFIMPTDWQPCPWALRFAVHHVVTILALPADALHPHVMTWAYQLRPLFPDSRNRQNPHDANVDLGFLQVTDVWGGVGGLYSLQEVSPLLSKARPWGLQLAGLKEELQVSQPLPTPLHRQ